MPISAQLAYTLFVSGREPAISGPDSSHQEGATGLTNRSAGYACYLESLKEMRILPWIAIALALPLLPDDRSKEPLTSTHTDRFNVAAAVAIRMENSFGEVDIDGWDRRVVEVTVVRLSEHLQNAKDRAEAQRRLDSVQVTAKQSGNDIVISTVYPSRNLFSHPLSRRSDIEIAYRIRAPHASRLVIDHNRGEVNVSHVSGDIHATVVNGQITLTLAPGSKYAMDAACGLGDVYSDFEGREKRRYAGNEEFVRPNGTPTANLYLRVHVGDIVIVKQHGPPAD